MGTGELLGRLAAVVVCIGCAALGLVICADPEQSRNGHLKAVGWTTFGVGVSFMVLLALDTLRQMSRGRGPRNRPDA